MYRGGNAGTLEVTESGLALPLYDHAVNTLASTTDTWNFYLRGVKVATVVLTYSDSGKGTLIDAQRTF